MNAARIVSQPAVMMGKPVVEGTRITVEHLLEELPPAGRPRTSSQPILG